MSLSVRLNEDMKQAMKDKNKLKKETINMVRSAIKYQEIDLKRPLTDDEVLTILNREVKQRNDSLQDFKKAEREDLIEKVTQELAIIEAYLPQQLSEDEIRDIVRDTVTTLGASTKAEMGKVMGALMPKTKGRADGKLVNKIVQEFLN
jgi:uncharacterized protein YqeY